MKDQVLDKIKALSLKAKEQGRNDVNMNVASGTTALSEAIKTPEQADEFMKLLKALG